MTPLQLVSQLRSRNVQIWADGDKLRFRAPEGALDPNLAAQLKQHKVELLTFLQRSKGDVAQPMPGNWPQTRVGERYPLSLSQYRMWFLQQAHPETSAYNVYCTACMTGPLDLDVVDAALVAVANRHDSLRITVRTENGVPLQVIGPHVAHVLESEDLTALPPEEQDAQIERLARAVTMHVFNLEQGPLFRVKVLRVSPARFIWVECFHHLIADDWSLKNFTREWMENYEHIKDGKPIARPPLPIQFPQFAAWQRDSLKGEKLDRELAYWKNQLAGELPILELAVDHPRQTNPTFSGTYIQHHLPSVLKSQVKRWSSEQGVTPFMTLFTAYLLMLRAYSRQNDIIVGSPVAGRTTTESETLIGCCISVATLRTSLAGDPTARELLDRVRMVCREVYDHQGVPLEFLLNELKINRDPTRNSIFQTMVALQNTPSEWKRVYCGITMEILPIHNTTAKLDFACTINETESGLHALAEFDAGLIEVPTARNMLTTFERALAALMNHSDQPISALPLADPISLKTVQPNWPSGDREFSGSIQERIAHHASERPDAVAVEFQGQSLTYRDLDRRAESLGHELLELGLGPDRLAAIYLPRSIELIVAMIAVWKAGGAMLPLDPSTPADRVAALISDSGATIALTTRALLGMIPESVHRICVEECTCRPSTNPLPPGVPEHLAYVIYTSGSTGQPKGVAVEHRALSEYIGGACGVYQIDSSDRVLQFASLGFDTMIEELFPTLACGATVVLRTPEMLESFDAFIEKCDEWKISVISPPTSYWARLVSAISGSGLSIPPCVRLTIIGGEAARPKSVELWKSVRGNSDLANTYGPTEATVVATAWILKHSDDRSFDVIPIGAPLAHSEIHLLNEGLQPVPLGAPGELYIGGRALARGYLHRPDLTAESFVSRPRTGQRLYRTGDLARYRPDGSLEFLGRVDHQVKIRGFRVEVGEVESMIETHPEVAECVVAAYRNSIDELQLTAFVVLRSARGPTPAGLRQFLKDRAPAFLVPASIAIAPALPRLANGKIDHHALPALLAGLEPEEGEFVAPATETEKQVAAIWAEVLPVERIGAHDDFFSLGGHSLQMTQILSRVRSVFDVAVSLAAFFERPTVSGMAEAILSSAVSTRAPKRPQSFASDAILGPEFTRIDKPFRSVPKGPILLTGSTGFLGAFLLRELLLQTEQSIFCLVRTVDAESGLSRIRRALESYGIWDNRAAARIRPIPGDLGKPRLGLPPALFEGLANEVRSIYHCGATVNFFYPYSVLKSANVDGTREIHRLAVTGPVKPVFFVSTTSIAGNRSPDRLPNGYDQTKWVAEQMTRNAIELGIPAAIFRPAALSGDTRTGACNADDFIHRFLRGCIALGAAPTVDSAIDLLPVDLVSRDIVAESLNPACLGLTYNMINQRKSCLTHLTRQLDALGFPIRHEPYSHWRARLAGLEETHPLAPIAALFPEKETSAGSELDLSGVPTDEAISITYPSADHHLGILASYLRKQGLVGETRHKALVES